MLAIKLCYAYFEFDYHESVHPLSSHPAQPLNLHLHFITYIMHAFTVFRNVLEPKAHNSN